MRDDAMTATIVTVLETAITETGTDEEDPLNRAVVAFQEDGTIALVTWSGNVFLITVQPARVIVAG